MCVFDVPIVDPYPDDETPGTFAEYQRNVLRTANLSMDQRDRLLNCALGAAGEAGEFADMTKKWAFHGHPLDRDKALKELGDALWYLAWAAHELGTGIAEVAELNVAKLRARYPNGFNSQDSIERRDTK